MNVAESSKDTFPQKPTPQFLTEFQFAVAGFAGKPSGTSHRVFPQSGGIRPVLGTRVNQKKISSYTGGTYTRAFAFYLLSISAQASLSALTSSHES